jgi:hypothetical protein
MILSERERYFLQILVLRFGLKPDRKDIYRCDCVACGDSKTRKSKKRMYFLPKNDSVTVYCHNCGYSSNLFGFINDFASDLLEQYKFFGFVKKPKGPSAKDIKVSLIAVPKKDKKEFTSTKEIFSLTKCFSELKETHPARRYIEFRKIPLDKVRFCQNFYSFIEGIGMPDLEPYKGYKIPCIIIPFFKKDDKIKIIQARFFDAKVKPKYLTVKLDPDERKIYNADFVDYSKEIYVLEGPFDSMAVPNAIALAGSDGTPEREGDYIWCLDNERSKITHGKILKKIEQGYKVIIWKKEDKFKDINEGISKNMFTFEEIPVILKKRIKKGLEAKLALSLL